MSKEIYLVRHGLPAYEYDSEGRKLMYGPDAHLSDQGRDHVHALARKLSPLDVIYTSPFVRAKETAEILADNLGVEEVIEDPALSDFYSYGTKGKLLDDVLAGNVPALPDDETIREAFDRVLHAFEEIRRKEMDRKVGIVSHGHPIRFIVWKYFEGKNELPANMDEFVQHNYVNQAEAWVLTWDENGKLIRGRIIPRDDNPNPGIGKW